jgi:hypothetical protein
MPFFKTTVNIFIDAGEHFDPNWMDSDKLVLPPKTDWDYQREMKIEDVDIWEMLFEGGYGVYAAWSPYAEFYLIKPPGWIPSLDIETFYGPGANKQVMKRMKELGIPFTPNKIWVDNEDMWLYE